LSPTGQVPAARHAYPNCFLEGAIATFLLVGLGLAALAGRKWRRRRAA
jgi:hypothetical protein